MALIQVKVSRALGIVSLANVSMQQLFLATLDTYTRERQYTALALILICQKPRY